MKHFLISSVMLIISVTAVFAQGTVIFNNRISSTINAPIYGPDGVTRLSGADYWAQLYAGPDANSLQPIGMPTPFRTGAAAGFWQSQALTIPTVAPGALAVLQARVCYSGNADDTPDYPTYDSARNAGQLYLSSAYFNVTLGGGNPPLPDANILGNPELPSTPLPDNLSVFFIPEPSVIVLGAWGAAGLLIRQRR